MYYIISIHYTVTVIIAFVLFSYIYRRTSTFGYLTDFSKQETSRYGANTRRNSRSKTETRIVSEIKQIVFRPSVPYCVHGSPYCCVVY